MVKTAPVAVKSAKSVSAARRFFDEAPQHSWHIVSELFWQRAAPPPRPPPFVAAAVSQLLIKTIPGYCRGLMRHTHT